jgi:ubiquinone/menaquinone biosynthesis C-methylase UbiE
MLNLLVVISEMKKVNLKQHDTPLYMEDDLMDEGTVKKVYNSISESYDETFAGGFWILYDAITWEYIKEYLPQGECTVLDAGGGTGKWTIKLAKRGCRVYLTDLSPKMLEKAKEKIEKEGLSERVHISEGDVCTMDFPSDFFDFVLCEGDPVSYCAENYFQALQELVRVAKPHAIIEVGVDSRFAYVGTFTSQSTEAGLTAFEKGIAYDPWKAPIFTFTPRILREELDRCGADLLEIVGKPILWDFTASYMEDLKNKIENDIEFRNKIIEFEIALNKEGFGPAGGHLQVIARKR